MMIKLSAEEKAVIKYVEDRDYDGLGKYLEKHEFDSKLLRAIWNFARRMGEEDKCL